MPLAKKIIPGPQIPAACTTDCIDSLLALRKLVKIPIIPNINSTIKKIFIYLGFISFCFLNRFMVSIENIGYLELIYGGLEKL